MVGIRERVSEDRTFLKKLELAIPGFRGYRKREDRRVADALLRKQLADGLKECGKQAEEIRDVLASQMELDLLKSAGYVVNEINALEAKVRHAEQGYAGVAADINVLEKEIEKLYEFDYMLIENTKKLRNLMDSANSSMDVGDIGSLKTQIRAIRAEIKNFNSLFNKRIGTITNTGVFA